MTAEKFASSQDSLFGATGKLWQTRRVDIEWKFMPQWPLYGNVPGKGLTSKEKDWEPCGNGSIYPALYHGLYRKTA